MSSKDEFIAYKILDAFYNEKTNVISYELTSDFKKFLSQSNIYKTPTKWHILNMKNIIAVNRTLKK